MSYLKKNFYFHTNNLVLGPHTITVLFNRIAIPETPLRIYIEPKEIKTIPDESVEESINKSSQTNSNEQRGRSTQPKQHVSTERARSLSTQTIFDPIHSRLSKSNENLLQPVEQKPISPNEPTRIERITKSEDRDPSNTRLNEKQIEKFNLIKEKFQSQQPIDTIFGIKNQA